MRLLAVFLLCLLLPGCYEDRVGCLNPDASNYDLEADSGCDGCCTFPELAIRVIPRWGDTTLVIGQTYLDGADNPFRIVRFRYYLGELQLETTGRGVEPIRTVALRQAGDDAPLTLNGNYALVTTAGVTTTTLGRIAVEGRPINGLSGTYGLPDRFRPVSPATAPAGDALRTQPGRLNFNDGKGYVQSRLEYTRVVGADTVLARVSSYGSVPFQLSFRQDIDLVRGFNLRLDLEADLQRLLGSIDLTQDSASVAEALGAGVEFLSFVSLTQ